MHRVAELPLAQTLQVLCGQLQWGLHPLRCPVPWSANEQMGTHEMAVRKQIWVL